MSTTAIAITLEHVACYTCGVTFGIETRHIAGLRRSRAIFCCPSGHGQQFIGETDAERERRLRDRAERALAETREQRDRALTREADRLRQLRATRGVVTRLKNRVARGVCPCCNRTFANLGRHMTSQHPDFAGDA